jgi:hypothetical protein
MRPLIESSIAILVGAMAAPVATSQSISDYSRAQRALIEAGMAQAAARVVALGASGATSAASASSAPARVEVKRKVELPEPQILVDGVFDGSARSLVELRVDGHPYLLSPGEAVPGTPWRVGAIAVDRVVLTRPGTAAGAARPAPAATTRTYALPALH